MIEEKILKNDPLSNGKIYGQIRSIENIYWRISKKSLKKERKNGRKEKKHHYGYEN